MIDFIWTEILPERTQRDEIADWFGFNSFWIITRTYRLFQSLTRKLHLEAILAVENFQVYPDLAPDAQMALSATLSAIEPYPTERFVREFPRFQAGLPCVSNHLRIALLKTKRFEAGVDACRSQ
jgi:hypothetical protein